MQDVGLQLLHDGFTSAAAHTVMRATQTPGNAPDVLCDIAATMLMVATQQGFHMQLLEVFQCVCVCVCVMSLPTSAPTPRTLCSFHPSTPIPTHPRPPQLPQQVSDTLCSHRSMQPLLRAIVLQAHAQGGMSALVSVAAEGLRSTPHTLQVCTNCTLVTCACSSILCTCFVCILYMCVFMHSTHVCACTCRRTPYLLCAPVCSCVLLCACMCVRTHVPILVHMSPTSQVLAGVLIRDPACQPTMAALTGQLTREPKNMSRVVKLASTLLQRYA